MDNCYHAVKFGSRVRIINLTQHIATEEQIAAGVFEPTLKDKVKQLLTFEEIPDADVLKSRAAELANVARAEGAEAAMIGGAPYLMAEMETMLRLKGIKPLYAFTKREVIEEPQADGSVKKMSVFRFLGFVEK